MSTIYKLILINFFFLTFFNLEAIALINKENCNNFNFIKKEISVKKIKIELNKYRKWQINNIGIIIDNSHIIKKKFKKKFKANLLVTFENNTVCKFKANVRPHGDLKDHISYKDGKIFQSLDVELKNDHINNIVKFKLFLPDTRGVEEDEIFMTEILRSFNFISPRTNLVDVMINENKIQMLFQEKTSKELLEFNNRKEGAMFEGEEKYMMGFSSKVKNLDGINWSQIFSESERAQNIQLSRQTNSNWSIKNLINQNISFEALSYLNYIYLVYVNNYKDKKNSYSFLDYHLDNNLLALENRDNLLKLDMYDALILSASGNHSLYVHNRKFYWNTIENYFEPIYYDGEFNLLKEPTKLNFPVSLNYLDAVEKLEKGLKNIDVEKFTLKVNNRGLNFNENKVNNKINRLIKNLELIKDLYVSKDIREIEYNNNSFKNKKIFEKYQSNLINNEINVKFLYLIDQNKDSTVFNVCKNNQYQECVYEVFSNKKIRDILENELNRKRFDYKYIGSLEKPKSSFNKIILNNDYFKNVLFYFNDGIKYSFDSQNNVFIINQINESGRAFFSYGEIKDIKITFSGFSKKKETNYNNRLGEKGLTGCLSFYKTKFNKTALESLISNCEDGINFMNTSGLINKIKSINAMYDGIDIDFSSLIIEKVEISNSMNDCLDLSYGNYLLKDLDLSSCGDKGISVGEKSRANIKRAKVKNSGLGIASKDSSIVNVDNLEIKNTKICVSAYKKKQEFSGAILKIKKLNCSDFNIKTKIDKNSFIDLS